VLPLSSRLGLGLGLAGVESLALVRPRLLPAQPPRPSPRSGLLARAGSLGLAGDFLRLSLKSCVLARLCGRLCGGKRSEVEVFAPSVEEGTLGARPSRPSAPRLLPDELAQVALFLHIPEGFERHGLVILPNFSISSETLTLPSISLRMLRTSRDRLLVLPSPPSGLAGLGENRSAIHTLVRFIDLK